jgi:hypothetical protein
MENPDNIKNAGRKPFDEVMMFRVIILQSLYGLSDDQMEYQLKDRRSFERFVSGGALYQMLDQKQYGFTRSDSKNMALPGRYSENSTNNWTKLI